MRLAAVAAVVLWSQIAHAGGGGIVIPPAEVDVGVGAPLGAQATVGADTEILAGVHWASLYWKPTPVDIGIGYVGSFRQVLPGYEPRATMPPANDNELSLNGVYFDVAKTLQQHTYWRMWLAVRGELLAGSVNHNSFSALGGAVRIATELYGGKLGCEGDHGGFAAVAGTFALGVYVEASHRELSPELGPNAVTAGVSVRVPFLAAVVN